MRRRLPGDTEIVNCLDDAAAKQVMPNTVHHYPGDKRIGRIDHSLSQIHSATPTNGRLALGQGLEERTRHQLARWRLMIAANQDRLILATAIK